MNLCSGTLNYKCFPILYEKPFCLILQHFLNCKHNWKYIQSIFFCYIRDVGTVKLFLPWELRISKGGTQLLSALELINKILLFKKLTFNMVCYCISLLASVNSECSNMFMVVSLLAIRDWRSALQLWWLFLTYVYD